MVNTREFDFVIFGATGFTGYRTALYVAQAYNKHDNLRWAIAGRSFEKLKEVREKLTAVNSSLESLPIITADSADEAALEAMTARTKVVITTVGPFLQYGTPLVAACVKTSTHYIDSTGEPPFVKKVIDRYHDLAEDKGIFVVPCSAFDSIPSDLGTKMVVDYMRDECNAATKSVKFSVTKLRGGASGGTLASAVGILEDKEAGGLKELMDQNLLIPKETKSLLEPAQNSSMLNIYYDHDFKKWQGFFVMSSVNEKIVKRSHALAVQKDGVGYGHQFKYSETLSFPGLISASVASIALVIGSAGLLIGPIRTFAKKYILPAPGTGSSDEAIAKGHFTVCLVGESALDEQQPGEEKAQPIRVMATVKGIDPGYGETCRMLVESAMCIVNDESRVKALNNTKGGVLTPASAFGQVLIERLRKKGMTWTVAKL